MNRANNRKTQQNHQVNRLPSSSKQTIKTYSNKLGNLAQAKQSYTQKRPPQHKKKQGPFNMTQNKANQKQTMYKFNNQLKQNRSKQELIPQQKNTNKPNLTLNNKELAASAKRNEPATNQTKKLQQQQPNNRKKQKIKIQLKEQIEKKEQNRFGQKDIFRSARDELQKNKVGLKQEHQQYSEQQTINQPYQQNKYQRIAKEQQNYKNRTTEDQLNNKFKLHPKLYENMIQQKQAKIKQLETQIKTLTNQNIFQKTKLKEFENQIKKRDHIIESLKLPTKRNQPQSQRDRPKTESSIVLTDKKHQALEYQNFQLKKKLQQLQDSEQERKRKNILQLNNNIAAQKESKETSNQLLKVQGEFNQLKQKYTKISNQLEQLKHKFIENQKKNRISSQVGQQLQIENQQISTMRQKIVQLTTESSHLKSLYSQVEKQNEQLRKQGDKMLQKEPLGYNLSKGFNHLFHGDVLKDNYEGKIFLKDCIEKHQKIDIVDTKLIYRYDPINKQNIHKYIDQKPQLVVVIKLVNGYYLAGYTQGVFKPKTTSEKEGLIMSLTNKQCYYLMEKNRRAIAYDDFFVIFGNSQIRIKSQQKKVFSNFGLSNSYYRHNGDGVPVLLGGTKSEREIEIVSYQFFQLVASQ